MWLEECGVVLESYLQVTEELQADPADQVGPCGDGSDEHGRGQVGQVQGDQEALGVVVQAPRQGGFDWRMCELAGPLGITPGASGSVSPHDGPVGTLRSGGGARVFSTHRVVRGQRPADTVLTEEHSMTE